MRRLMASHGKRGIANLEMLKVKDPGASLFTVVTPSQGAGEADSESQMVNVYVDSFPKDDWWMPPLHGDDVDSFSDNLMKELDEQRHNYTEFTSVLETNGCSSSSLEKDSLLCFKDEEDLQHPLIRREICGGIDDEISSLSTSFFYKMEKGRIIRPSAEELRRCLDSLPENLGDIAWKDEFQSYNDCAVEAAKRSEWKTACDSYGGCLLLVQLTAVKESVSANLQAWLILWVCIPLAYLYQYRLRNYSSCVTLYDAVLEHLNKTDDANVVELYYSVIWHRRMVLFQWSYTFKDQPLIAKYVRSRAFSAIQIVEDFAHYRGFVILQRIINFWGRRTQRGLEGDMRVALCSNLEHLYRESKQWSEAVEWTKEKWRWICTFSDIFHELNVQWRFHDVQSLYHAGRCEEAQRMIGALEESATTSLPDAVNMQIKYWKASFLKDSNLIEANKQLQDIRRKLEGKELYKELLVLVKLDISNLNLPLRQATIFNRAPFGVEVAQEWDDDVDSTVIGFLNDISSNLKLESTKESYLLHLNQGLQLLMSLAKHFKARSIEEYRDRVHEAKDHFQKCLNLMAIQEKDAVRFRDEVFEHEEVETRRSSDRHEILCYLSLGQCAIYAKGLKPSGVKYNENLKKEMHPSVEVAHRCLAEANNYLQKSLSLAVEKGFDGYVSNAREKLGFLHYFRAQEYYEWLKNFKDSMPAFRGNFAHQNGSEKSEVELHAKQNCGNIWHEHYHALKLLKNQVSCIFYQFPQTLGSSSPSSSTLPPQNPNIPFEQVQVVKISGDWRNTGVVDQCLTDALLEKALRITLCGLMKQTIREIRQSTDYLEGSLIKIHDVGSSAPFCRAEEQSQHVPHLGISERMKMVFTHLQRLIASAVAIKDMIGDDAELLRILSFKADPATAEFLRCERGDLTRKALLWAERGRSQSLVRQLLGNKSIHGMVNMADDQLDIWNEIRNSRLSCGKNAVFVEYTFDAAHEYKSDLIQFNRIVTWIVYVVTKDDEVHMRTNVVQSLSHVSKTLRDINENLSKGVKNADVKEDLTKLHCLLIEPISDLLRGMDVEDKLVFAADEVFTNVPFSILLDAKTEKYLFQNHTVSFTPSLRILEHCHTRLKLLQESNFKVEPSVALGDPAFLVEKRRLKRTYFEVQGIRSLFNKGSVKVLTGTEATVDNLVRYSKVPTDTVQGFIHVAAHNHVDNVHKAGRLELADPSCVTHQDPPSDALEDATNWATRGNDLDAVQIPLDRAEEVQDRKARQAARQAARQKANQAAVDIYLPSERIMQHGSDWRSCMVVLSACNSAKGYVFGSEGVVGLPRAFLFAGVPCIVASQWELEDESSSKLMVEFYREMSGGTTDAASALRAAMIQCMVKSSDVESGSSRQVADVYEWGGYLVWGLPTVTLSPSVMQIHAG